MSLGTGVWCGPSFESGGRAARRLSLALFLAVILCGAMLVPSAADGAAAALAR